MIPTRFQEAILAAALQTEARDAFARGPAPLEGTVWEAKRYGVLDCYDDALDAVTQRPRDAYPALWRVLHQAVALRYEMARRWPAKDKWLLSDLDGWDPSLAMILRAFYQEREPSAALELVRRALRLVLGSDDDLRIHPWESEPSLPPA